MRSEDVVDRRASVSVIIPCFQCSRTIARAVRSIERQTLKPAEIILVEDASGDDTLDMLREIERSHPGWIKVLALEKNVGAGSARNLGWDAASQPYIAFLDADDAWHPKKIEIQYQWMASHPDAQITAHGRLIVDGAGSAAIEVKDLTDVAVVPSWKLLLSNRFSTPTVMLKKSLPYRFPEHKRYAEDYLLWLQIRLDGIPIYYLNHHLTFLYKNPYGEGGLSANLWRMECAELAVYSQLATSRRLNVVWVVPLCLWSLVKFGRRLFVTFFR